MKNVEKERNEDIHFEKIDTHYQACWWHEISCVDCPFIAEYRCKVHPYYIVCHDCKNIDCYPCTVSLR